VVGNDRWGADVDIDKAILGSKFLSTVVALAPKDSVHSDSDYPSFIDASGKYSDNPKATVMAGLYLRNGVEDKKLTESVISQLNTAGIVAQAEPTKRGDMELIVDMSQAGFKNNVGKLMIQHRTAIIQQFKDVEVALAHTNFPGRLHFLTRNIPSTPDGKALDVEYAASVLAEYHKDLKRLAERFGVAAVYEALIKPVTGRGRASVDK
jgi:hypothetical protein